MSILDDLASNAQPGYGPQVTGILQQLLDTFGDTSFEGVDRDAFALHAIGLIERSSADAGPRLTMLRGLASLGWWSDVSVGDREIAALSNLARKIQFDYAKGVKPGLTRARPEARRNHAVFVGTLIGLMHSPTRGSFDYVRALAADPQNTRIDVYHSGALTDPMREYGEALLGESRARVSYVSTTGPDWFAHATAAGPYTYHFWCEDPLAQHISLLAMLGPSVMFTCGDVAPVQFADVYWYGHEEDYIADLWSRQGAPDSFIRNYRYLESTPLNLPKSAATRTRSDLGVAPEETILVSVGNRLGTDLSQPFVDGLGAFLSSHPGVRWLAVGGLHEYWQSAFRRVWGRQFMHIAFDEDLPSLFTACDIFANPFRAGGGHSSVIAIDAGAVVLARGDHGDVGACIPPSHRAHGVADYFAKLDQLVGDPALRSAWSAEQTEFLARCSDQKTFAGELRAACDLAYRRFAGRLPVVREALFAQS